MQVPLTEQQRQHLRRVREEQLADWRAGRPQVVDEMFLTDEVVRLMSGMGRACYLGLDGRVWVGNLGEGQLPKDLDDSKDVASCIIRWAGDIGLPELIDALPPMPEVGEVCSLCRGTRYMPDEFIGDEERRWYFCRRCGGLGWTIRAEQVAATDRGRDDG
jgi:hypothetical protein